MNASSPLGAPWFLTLVLAALGMLVYANALGNGFVLDDRGIILQHPLVQHPGSAWRAFSSPYWPDAVGGGQYRPLGILSFALDWRLAGNNPSWFHAVNVLWHGGVVALVFAVARQLLPLAGAVVAASVFAVHPVHVEAVANVVGRLELMAGAGVLGMLLLHARGSRWAPVALAGALLSKEHAIVAPCLAVVFDMAQTPLQSPRARRRSLYIQYAAVSVVWGAVMVWALRGTTLSTTSAVYADASLGARLLTVVSVVAHYARLLLTPVRLSADYEPDVVQLVQSPTVGVVVGSTIIILTAIVVLRCWRTEPALAAVLAMVPVTLAPVSNVLLVTGVALAERTLYLPSVGVSLAAGWLLSRRDVSPRMLGTVSLAVVALMAVRTWTRTPVWRDARSFALALLEEHPESYRGHWVAGRVFQSTGDIQAANREMQVARTIYGRDTQLLRESAAVVAAMGQPLHARALQDSAAVIENERRIGMGGTP